MALTATPVVLPPITTFAAHEAAFGSLRAYDAQQRERGTALGRLVKFQIADGFAWYRVERVEPLTLAHVEYGDCYTIDAAHLRGLALDDVIENLRRSDAWMGARR